MSLVSDIIANMVNGVSQQPPELRLPSQAQSQINGYSSVVDGLGKRPGTVHIKRLPATLTSEASVHTINRDPSERYTMFVYNGGVRVFDMLGNEKAVAYPEGAAYLASSDPRTDFRCITVADHTFILNTKTVVQESQEASPNERPYQALYWVKQGTYGATYSVVLNGAVYSHTTPDGGSASHSLAIRTDAIANQMKALLEAALPASDWEITQQGSQLTIWKKDNAPYTIEARDSVGDTVSAVFMGKVQRFSALPERAINNLRIEITGDEGSSFDNYFVRYETTDGSFSGAGVWKESVKGGEKIAFSAATMPHILVREADGSFTFKKATWAQRAVGDIEMTPMPSFVGKTITDVFFHRNRLGFVSEENVVMSRTGDYFNFFRGTATAVLDDDPIDIGVSHTKVSMIRHAVPFSETLLLFSDQTQFKLAKTDVLTPDTATFDQTTEYECSLAAKPAGVGRHVYFTLAHGNYAGLKEYYVDKSTEVLDAAEVTSHVPKYIPNGVFKIAASGTENCLCVLTNGARNKAFLYKFYWEGNQKLQSAWFEWEFSEDSVLMNADFIESTLYLTVKRGASICLEQVHLEAGRTESDWDILVHLDRKVTDQTAEAVAYVGGDANVEGDDYTAVTLPYATSDNLVVVTAPGGTRPEGYVEKAFTAVQEGGRTTLRLPGNWVGQPLYIGTEFEFSYEFSPIFVRNKNAGGTTAITSGRLQVTRMAVQYDNTGFFEVNVYPSHRDSYRYVMVSKRTGDKDSRIGRMSVASGTFRFPVMSKNTEVAVRLSSKSYLPCHFLSAEWEGLFYQRAQRL